MKTMDELIIKKQIIYDNISIVKEYCYFRRITNLNNAEYQRLVACKRYCWGVNNTLTTRITNLPNLTANERDDMFADAL